MDHKTEALCSLVCAVKGSPPTPDRKSILTIDQGAGSTEIAFGTIGAKIRIEGRKSYRLGARVLVDILRERALDFDGFEADVKRRISRYEIPWSHNVRESKDSLHVVLFGSVATEFAWRKRPDHTHRKYDPSLVHGTKGDSKELGVLARTLSQRSPLEIPGDRSVASLLPGLKAIELFLRKLGADEFVVSGYGTRHGLAWILANR